PVFLFLLRPRPSALLFPYTTLFRSGGLNVLERRLYVRGVLLDAVGGIVGIGGKLGVFRGQGQVRINPEAVEVRRNVDLAAFVQIDRKSTRLNSSHLGISYAVFCLKK